MGRKRTELPHDVQTEIEARITRGESLDTIVSALGGKVSRSKVDRIRNELRAGASGRPSGAPAAPVPAAPALAQVPAEGGRAAASEDVPETIPDGTPLERLDHWIKTTERMMQAAEAAKNLSAYSSLAMRLVSLSEARRKSTPIPKPDPNENPDWKALADWGEKELVKRVHALFTEG